MSSWSSASVGAPNSLLKRSAPTASSGFETAVTLVAGSAICLSSCRSAFAVSGWLTGVLEGETSHVCHLETARAASGKGHRQRAIRASASEQIQDSAPDGIRTHAGAGLSRLPLPFGLRGPAIRGGCDPSALEGEFLGAWRRSGACIARPTREGYRGCIPTEENAATCVPGRREASRDFLSMALPVPELA
jgi:hypothetical protein